MAGGSMAGGSMADRFDPAGADPVPPAADAMAPMAAAEAMEEPATGGNASVDPPTRTTFSPQTPLPPTQRPGSQGAEGQPGPSGPGSYPGQPGFPGQQGYQGQQGYPGSQGYSDPQGYSGQQGYPGASRGTRDSSNTQSRRGTGPARAIRLLPGSREVPPEARAVRGGLASQGACRRPRSRLRGCPADRACPAPTSGTRRPRGRARQRKRPRWLIPAGAAAAVVAIVVALVLALSPGSPKTAAAGQSSGPSTTPSRTHSASPSPQATPTVGNLQLAQLQVGDCLTGANLNLNLSTPWPKLSEAVPCSQGHTAEVFYANNYYWPKIGSYPGDATIKKDATAECDSAFQSYVGIAYSQSQYTWTDIVPDASTWPDGDRGLHCVAYYAPTGQPAGATVTGSIKGTGK